MYKTEAKDYTISEFITKYKSSCPLLFEVKQGYYGNIPSDTYDRGQIVRVQYIKNIPRITGRTVNDHMNLTLNFPINDQFRVRTKKGTIKSMKDIAKEKKFPYRIQLAEAYTISCEDRVTRLDESVHIILDGQSNLRCLVGNPITGDKLYGNICTIPEHLKDLRVSMVTGLEGSDTDHWAYFQRFMSDIVDKYIKFDDKNHVQDPLSLLGGFENKEKTPYYQYLWYDHTTLKPGRNPGQLESEPIYSIIPEERYQSLPEVSGTLPRKSSTTDHGYITDPPPVPTRTIIQTKPPVVPPKPVLTSHQSFERTQIVEQKLVETKGDERKLEELTITDISQILRQLKLDRYIEPFADSLVDGMILKDFNEEIMKDFGLTRLEKLRLMKFVQHGHLPH